MLFEVFTRKGARSNAAFVTIRRSGAFAISTGAYELLGSPSAVLLLYSTAEGGIVGMRPCDPGEPDAFLIRSSATKPSDRTVGGVAFTRHYEIDTSGGKRYPAWVDEGDLCFKLSTGRAATSSRVVPVEVPRSRPEPERVARNRDMRQWAIKRGYVTVGAPGRLPQTVIDMYDQEHG